MMKFLDLIPLSSHAPPLSSDVDRARLTYEALADSSASESLAAMLDDPRGRAFLDGAFDGSPYLCRAAEKSSDSLDQLFREGPDAAFDAVMRMLDGVADAGAQPVAMSLLRKTKLSAAMIIGLSDLAGIWSLDRVTGAVSALARAATDSALAWLLRDAVTRKIFVAGEQSSNDLLRSSGLIILGMGKLGADELNYSSDIDLIFLFDPEKIEARRPDRLQHEMVRLARGLVTMLEELTRDGYVFRTDLRLRPDPASTPMALSIAAAETYYESAGQNWERAAMIKARPIAGDLEAGAEFLRSLRPFIWRRSLDFNAIRDIQSIKRQIDRKQGGEPPSAFDHNVKLGRGGIREIEFFAQTQQLIWGGRDASLRSPRTLDAIAALVAAGHVTVDVAEDMTIAYEKLRTLEHRLQMVDDRQTHQTPDADDAYGFARFAGYETVEAFRDDLVATLETVEDHYAELFAEEEGLGGGRALSFTGADDHPDTLATIEAMGFKDPKGVADTVRGWHHGRIRAVRTARAREILTELTPDLLARFGAAPAPDAAFSAFAKFLAGLPAGVQVFSLFEANRGLLDFLARNLGRSPYLADHINQHPNVLDAVLTDAFMQPLGTESDLSEDLAFDLGDAVDFQDVLDGTRRWLSEIRLRLAVQTLEARMQPVEAAKALSYAADVVADRILTAVTSEFEATHGILPGGQYAVLAYGKWGSRELTIGSDLDLVAVYDAPDDAQSDGARSLGPAVYYMRLTQRLITALSIQTGEGRLFEIDMRLRPSGDDGPIAVHLGALSQYVRSDAWTWEKMALTRARCAIGATELCRQFESLRREVLSLPKEKVAHLQAVADMRRRIEASKTANGLWDVKLCAGGMVDAEFIAQGLAVLYGANEAVAAARAPADQFTALAEAGGLSVESAALLSNAAHFWLSAQWIVRLLGLSDEILGTEQTRQTIASALGYADYAALEAARDSMAATVQKAYETVFGEARAVSE